MCERELGLSGALAFSLPLFTEVPGRKILQIRTSPLRSSKKFVRASSMTHSPPIWTAADPYRVQ
jgi:hypothetical protein